MKVAEKKLERERRNEIDTEEMIEVKKKRKRHRRYEIGKERMREGIGKLEKT